MREVLPRTKLLTTTPNMLLFIMRWCKLSYMFMGIALSKQKVINLHLVLQVSCIFIRPVESVDTPFSRAEPDTRETNSY